MPHPSVYSKASSIPLQSNRSVEIGIGYAYRLLLDMASARDQNIPT